MFYLQPKDDESCENVSDVEVVVFIEGNLKIIDREKITKENQS